VKPLLLYVLSSLTIMCVLILHTITAVQLQNGHLVETPGSNPRQALWQETCVQLSQGLYRGLAAADVSQASDDVAQVSHFSFVFI
jgi:hypothetical protein